MTDWRQLATVVSTNEWTRETVTIIIRDSATILRPTISLA